MSDSNINQNVPPAKTKVYSRRSQHNQVDENPADNNINNNNNNNINSNNKTNDSYKAYWDVDTEIPEEISYKPAYDEEKPVIITDLHKYHNPVGKRQSNYDIITGLNPNANVNLPVLDTSDKYDSLARKIEKPKAKRIQTRENFMNDIVKLVGSNANRDIVRNNNLVSQNSANIWINKNHPDQGWKVESEDKDGDGIPEIMVYDSDDNLYSMNGYMIRKSDMGSREPYYEAFPTKAERKKAREEGITMSNFGAQKYKPKPINPFKPFDIEYEKNPYDDPYYLKQLLTHRAPHVPLTRSPYQVFTGFIAKSVWENFKAWLGTSKQVTKKLVENKGSKENPKWEFIKLRSIAPILAAPDMISYSAYAYENYVKDVAFEQFNNPNLFKRAFDKLKLKLANLTARVEVNPTPANKKKLDKLAAIFEDDDLLSFEIGKIITNSEAFKGACENIVKQMLNQDNRKALVQTLFKELVATQLENEQEIQAAARENRSVNLAAITKLETTQQQIKRKATHVALY